MAAHPRSVFVVDEAFLSLSWESVLARRGYPRTMIHEVRENPNLVVLQSLTKFYALPGLRLGYAIACPETAEEVRAQLVPWSVNALAQIAGIVALDDQEFTQRTCLSLTDNMLAAVSDLPPFSERLRAVSSTLHPKRSFANFVLVQLKGVLASQLVDRLLTRNILIRDASNFVGLDEHYVRIAIRTPAENEKLFTALADVLRG
jgi:threonine-phosphate decarboxylase